MLENVLLLCFASKIFLLALMEVTKIYLEGDRPLTLTSLIFTGGLWGGIKLL